VVVEIRNALVVNIFSMSRANMKIEMPLADSAKYFSQGAQNTKRRGIMNL